MNLILYILLLVSSVRAELFSVVQYGDVHAGSGRSRNSVATNTVPWILAHTNTVADAFGTNAGAIAAVVFTGDCYEDDESSVTNNYDPSDGTAIYSTVQFTNDLRILATSGLLTFVTDGNHDAGHSRIVVAIGHKRKQAAGCQNPQIIRELDR